MNSLCKSCANVREVVSGTGSAFLLCQLSKLDKRFPKYPPQPVVRCDGYEDEITATTNYTLIVLPGSFSICRLDAEAPVPEWASGEISSITRTPDELSIVCSQDDVPDGIRCETGWRCLRLAGQFDLSEFGVLSSLTKPLAKAKLSLFVVGTFDTDYLLVKNAELDSVVQALTAAGHTVQGI